MKASVHFGPSCIEYLVAFRNNNFVELRRRLILERECEILNVSTIVWLFTLWMRSMLLHDKEINWAKEEVYVHSDAVF